MTPAPPHTITNTPENTAALCPVGAVRLSILVNQRRGNLSPILNRENKATQNLHGQGEAQDKRTP